MTRIRWENLPSTSTPLIDTNLNKANNVVISSTEPNTGEEVWVQKGKNLFKGSGISSQSTYICPCKVGDVFTLSFTGSTTSSDVRLFLRTYNGSFTTLLDSYVDNQTINLSSTSNNYSKTITSTTNGFVYIRTAASYTNYTLNNIQLEQGSTATTYEAYIDKKIYTKNNNDVYEEFYEEVKSDAFKNDEVVVGSIRSKNMFDKNNPGILVGYGLSSNDGGLASNSQRTTSYFIEIKPSTNYVLSGATFAAKVFYDSNKTFISSTDETNFITPSNAKYFRFAWNNTIDFSQLQLEQGSEATNFMPFQDLDSKTYTSTMTYNTTYMDTPVMNKISRTGNVVHIYFIAKIKSAWSGDVDILTNLPANSFGINFRFNGFMGDDETLPQQNSTRIFMWTQMNGTSIRIYGGNVTANKMLYISQTYITTD